LIDGVDPGLGFGIAALEGVLEGFEVGVEVDDAWREAISGCCRWNERIM
jgi:hypothetical protein